MENGKSDFKPFARQILVCTDGECIPKKDAKKLIKQFRDEIDVARQAGDIDRTLCTRMGCAGICENGPIVAVWPDGVWYQGVTKKVMKRIVREHLVGGKPVSEQIFYQTPPVGAETEDAAD
jgi:(2Fe-2S) ferredoxin